ncbi:hypothetical protein SEA_REINDEER_82 [Mycobacterium phage Reindeer]|uniref:Uncharacterized protein n=1 Tax=Mycobacterium phage Reindeer TaxID=2762283 RepID=A0A7G8LI20_9CAUD|nr:hypothetical protein J4U05_gp082 [Mycobacterium phage Reindeer]QNJ56892.1 hypothetical protein SEA_REINDEER_82 [Mycobacterium phage Reindeer]
MSLRVEDIPLIKQLEDVLVAELDRQHLDGEFEPDSTGAQYFDAVDGEITGKPDWFKAVKAVVEALWEEEGR